MAVKFKMCPYCKKTKSDRLDWKYIDPKATLCPSCELVILRKHLGPEAVSTAIVAALEG